VPLLGERPTWGAAAGAVLALAGVAWGTVLGRAPKVDAPPRPTRDGSTEP
jgi:hypothetical protein